MMATTHAAAGLLLAVPLTVVAPDLAPVAALAGVAGGVFPDLDLLVGVHRKSLHFPDYYWVGAVPALAAAVVVPGPAVVAVAYFFLSAAVHSVADAFGAGTEPVRGSGPPTRRCTSTPGTGGSPPGTGSVTTGHPRTTFSPWSVSRPDSSSSDRPSVV